MLEELLSWSVVRHFFLTAMLYVYGRFLNKHLVKTIHSDHVIPNLFKYGLIKYHMLICYSLYIAGNNFVLYIFLDLVLLGCVNAILFCLFVCFEYVV